MLTITSGRNNGKTGYILRSYNTGISSVFVVFCVELNCEIVLQDWEFTFGV